MFGIIIALIVTVAMMVVGINVNAKWLVKLKGEQNLPPLVQRQFKKGKAGVGGIGILLAPILFALGFSTAAFICLGFSLLFVLIFLLMILFARLPLQLVGTYVLVGIGDVTRTVLKITLIGIPILRHIDYVAEYGMEEYQKELVRMSKKAESEGKHQESLSELLQNMSKSDESESVQQGQPQVKVWRGDGFGKEYLKVSSDGERYFDPDDGEWHRIKK